MPEAPTMITGAPGAFELLFKFNFVGGQLVPTDYKVNFEIKTISTEVWTFTQYPDSNGFIKVSGPKFPMVRIDVPVELQPKLIRLQVKGVLNERAEEVYLKVADGSDILYTLITDLCVHTGKLCIYNNTTYYEVQPEMEISTSYTSIYVNKDGVLYGYNNDSHVWATLGNLTFFKMEHPEALVSVVDGFYEADGGVGTISSGHLGSSSFADNYASVINCEPYLVNATVVVYRPGSGSPVYTHTFNNLQQGSLNYQPVLLEGGVVAPTDSSPTIETIETISGVTFSTAFKSWISSEGLGTVDKLRKAGPISYIDGFPSADITTENLNLLQGHVDFYSLNPDAEQNQIIIDSGYEDIYSIAKAQSNVFIDAVVTGGISLYDGARIRNQAVQNTKVFANTLGGLVSDLTKRDSAMPIVENNTFTAVLNESVNTCSCSDCQSLVSPFAYLMDLMKYGAAHISYSGSPSYSPTNEPAFASLLTNKFLQPFTGLPVDCETLHDTFCRVRLVTEVLEKLFDIEHPTGKASLTAERKEFLSLVYNQLLNGMGTNFNELRKVVAIPTPTEKETAAKVLCDKMGLPLRSSDSSDLIVDRIYLTFNGGSPVDRELTGANLQSIFGFRNTEENVLTIQPESFVHRWHSEYLKEVWYGQDYFLSAYSRENIVPGNILSYKDSFRPIVDPDIMGWEDMTYLTAPANNSIYQSRYSKEMWSNRKEDTDVFLKSCSEFVSRTSADMNSRILRVKDKNITDQLIDGGKIWIENPTSTWNEFNLLSLKANGANTDVLLKKSTPAVSQPAMVQPIGATPKMRYRRTVNVTNISGTTSVTLNLTNNSILDPLSGGYARLESTGGSSPYETNPPGTVPFEISAVSFNVATQQVTLTANAGLDGAFLAGQIKFTYEVEVPLYTEETLSPNDVLGDLFATTRYYNFLSPAPVIVTDPFPYEVWGTPSWGTITGTDYEKLKTLQQLITEGAATEPQRAIVTNDLRLDISTFNRMMALLTMAENHLVSMYTAPALTADELSELLSIFRRSGKSQLWKWWVVEETEYEGLGSTPIKIMLDGRYFWKRPDAPIFGRWDYTLQTIPDLVADISTTNIPIVDPELIKLQDVLNTPEAEVFRTLYATRRDELDTVFADFLGYLTAIPFNSGGFSDILNAVNTGDPLTAYTIPLPYSTLSGLVNSLNSNNAVEQHDATEVLWSVFSITREDFIEIIRVKTLYELNDPLQLPAPAELKKVVRLLVSGYKRLQLYLTTSFGTGWIEIEVNGTGLGGLVKYYNVLKMRLAPGRADVADKAGWLRTLQSWNRKPFVQPDLLPPENVKNFVSGNLVYTIWNTRNNQLVNAYSDIAAYINDAVIDAGTLFVNFKDQLDLIVARVETFDPLGATPVYLHYFTDLKEFEEIGVDIRPYLDQLGISITEYRYLRNIYDVLEQAPPMSTTLPLLASEYKDIIDIFIAIRSRNITFSDVLEEFGDDILFDETDFKLSNPGVLSLQSSPVSGQNLWRQNSREQRDRIDVLESRIDRKKGVDDAWTQALENTEDRTLPLMRDALIRALMLPCESFDEAAERLAKSLFIETKDNCCVKHTRVSFAIETIQGLIFALENGIYDEYVSAFSLTAPSFKFEWQWLGSYSSWRSAVLVLLYPENILYPTLKRSQSPAFMELANKLQTATSFSPDDACAAADEFGKYLNDVENMDVVSTASTYGKTGEKSPFDCCAEDNSFLDELVFYIGQGPSGKVYCSQKNYHDNSKIAHGFWEALPLDGKENVKVIGSYVSADRSTTDWTPFKMYLFVFYSFYKEGVLTMEYASKNLFKFGSTWEIVETQDLPKYQDTYSPYAITACQTKLDWMPESLIFSYKISDNPVSCNHIHYYYDHRIKEFVSQASQQVIINSDQRKVQSAIRVNTVGAPSNGNGLVLASRDKVYFTFLNNPQAPYTWPSALSIYDYSGMEILNVFEETQNTFIVTYTQLGLVKATRVTMTWSVMATDDPPPLSVSPEYAQVESIAPVFTYELSPQVFAIKTSSGSNISAEMDLTPTSIGLVNRMSLTPEIIAPVSIQSADCIPSMGLRGLAIKDKLNGNMSPPLPEGPNEIIRTEAIKTLLYEAYYFVPVLLALDQQSHGQFESALSWYRTVYDYTVSANNQRKVFYGLVLEEAYSNVVTYTSNWLMDPLNPHEIAQTRLSAYTKYTLTNIVQCLYAFADREFTLDTIETIPNARKLYSAALDLLKTPELQTRPNECYTALACLDTAINPLSNEWIGLYGDLKMELVDLGNASLASGLVTPIAALLNSGSETTLGSKFGESFTLIRSATPEPAPSKTLSELVGEAGGRSNNVGRYAMALSDGKEYNAHLNNNFAVNVSRAAGISPGEVNNPANAGRIAWFGEIVPDNSQVLKFEFANGSGVQNYNVGRYQLDPTQLIPDAWLANSVYSNLPRLFTTTSTNLSPDYMPLMNYPFCAPKNPVYDSLELKGNLELFKIFNCRNIAGMVRELDVFSAPTDSITGIPVIGASGTLNIPGRGNFSPSQYRFGVLIERAKQIAAQAQQMESLFLSALEKQDAESYGLLMAQQGLETAKATVKLQDLRLNQAADERSLAELQLNKVKDTADHFETLISNNTTTYENDSIENLKNSIENLNYVIKMQAGQAVALGAAAVLAATNPLTLAEAANIGMGAFNASASALSSTSAQYSTMAALYAQMASYERRNQEWIFQRDLAKHDIIIGNQQVQIAYTGVQVATQERAIAQLNTDHAEASLNFLQTKFTNRELYQFMGNVLESCYSYMLNLATSIARSAEQQLYFERQEQAGPFILNDYWNVSDSPFQSGGASTADRRGLTGSARLMTDITRLDQYAFDTLKRKLQLTKVISLSQNFPAEFQQFRQTGVLNFELTNQRFDYDFPGHYLRLVNTVKTTVVGLLPVYDSIKATLTASNISYTVVGGTTFQKVPIKKLELDSVALTSAINASGMFEMQPIQNGLLNPFEGMGVESRWEFKMPKFSNRVDYNNIADVLVTLEYTALENFQYRYQVLQELDYRLGFSRGFSFKNDFPDQWYELAEAQDGSATFGVTIDLKREMFPQGIDNLKLDGTPIILSFLRAEGYTQEIDVLDFNLATAGNTASGTTTEGKLPTTVLMSNLQPTLNPVMKLRLLFDNTPINRELFSKEQVTDILLLLNCKAELRSYPL